MTRHERAVVEAAVAWRQSLLPRPFDDVAEWVAFVRAADALLADRALAEPAEKEPADVL